MSIISNDKHSVGDLFSNRNPFIIPKHQRAYCWGKEEVRAFCSDISEIDSEYFFGGIVSVHQLAPNGPGRTYRVVDGQQRLATFTLLIAQLRNAFIELAKTAHKLDEQTNEDTAKSLAEELNNTYLTYMDTRQRPPIRLNRLTLSKIDKEFFEDLLDGKSTKETAISHKKLKNAWDIIDEELFQPILSDKLSSITNQLNKLQNLLEKILEQTVVIHIVCDELDEAYQLFEVLNDRGKELAIGDFLRSTTLEILESDEGKQNTVSNAWDEILSKGNAEKYIKTYLTSYVGTIKRSNLHRQFQKQFFTYDNNSLNVKEDVTNRVLNIKSIFKVYDSLVEGMWPYENPKTKSWEKYRLNMLIKQLEHKLCIPFFIAVYENSNEEEFKKIVLMTEKFVFRYITISEQRANRLSQIYNKHILKIRNNGLVDINEYRSDLKELLVSHCNDDLFGEQLRLFTYKNNSSTVKKMRYFLTTIEDYYPWYKDQKKSEIPYPSMDILINIDNVDIEHIYPQNPKRTNDSIEPLKHKIGNLTFWSSDDNKSASNETFDVKKQYYKNSNIALTRDLCKYTTWGEQEINERENLYVEIAKHVFNIYL